MYTYDLHLEIFFISVIFFMIIKVCILKYKKTLSYSNIMLSIMEIVYGMLLIKTVVLPITVGAEEVLGITFEIKSGIQILPFYTINKSIMENNWIQIIGNILLIMPLPIFISIFSERVKKKMLFLVVLCSSLLIEGAQLLINIVSRYNNHIVDIDDVILNVIGGSIVIIFIRPICSMIKKVLK